jgi:DNA-binding transcriptional MerR regulator/methylmalonyl-CoA mutase cobalamin-binding subunit
MSEPLNSPSRTASIAAAERETGLSKDTLRAWERRYGFPSPARGPAGERVYPRDQLAKLRLMRHLIDAGERPGRIAAMTIGDLAQLVQDRIETSTAPAAPIAIGHETFMDLLKAHDMLGLSRQLDEACLRMGLASFITDLVAPLTTRVGDAWMRGRLAVFEEHLFSEALQVTLRAATARMPSPAADARPRVLLTTFVGEPHGLGLLMAQGLLALDGAHCVSLGVETPVWDIALAAKALRSDVVALSFTGAMNPTALLEGLRELRDHLADNVELWAGGSAPALHRRALPGVMALSTLQEAHEQLRRWRTAASA